MSPAFDPVMFPKRIPSRAMHVDLCIVRRTSMVGEVTTECLVRFINQLITGGHHLPPLRISAWPVHCHCIARKLIWDSSSSLAEKERVLSNRGWTATLYLIQCKSACDSSSKESEGP